MMFDWHLYGFILQVIGLVMGSFGTLFIGLYEVRTRKEIKSEMLNSSLDTTLEREFAKSKRTAILLFILTVSFGLQLFGLAFSSV